MQARILKSASNLPKLTGLETAWKYACGAVSIPFGIRTIPANHVGIIIRNGKFDGFREPGIRWAPLGYLRYHTYLGDKNLSQDNMYITDSRKNPIIATTSVTYRVIDPLNHVINFQDNKVIPRYFESFMRQTLNKHTYDELLNSSKDILENFSQEINKTPKMEEYGIEIQRADLLDIKYSPEIAKAMLIKQQVQATIDARKHMVDGVVDVVEDINQKMKLDNDSRNKLATYLAISMITDKSPQMTYDLSEN